MTSTWRSAVGSSTAPKSALAEAAPATRAGIAASGRDEAGQDGQPERGSQPHA